MRIFRHLDHIRIFRNELISHTKIAEIPLPGPKSPLPDFQTAVPEKIPDLGLPVRRPERSGNKDISVIRSHDIPIVFSHGPEPMVWDLDFRTGFHLSKIDLFPVQDPQDHLSSISLPGIPGQIPRLLPERAPSSSTSGTKPFRKRARLSSRSGT